MTKNRALLRDFNQSDIVSLIAYLNNPNVTRYLTSRIPQPYSVDDAKWWVDIGSKVGVTKAVEVSGRFIGCIGVVSGEYEGKKSAEIGYWLEEKSWGKGIATEAVTEMTNDIFASTQIVRLFAPVFSPNKSSIRVLEKCGFKLEGILKSSAFKHGVFLDEHLYAKVNV